MVDVAHLLAANPDANLLGLRPPVTLSRFSFDSRIVEAGDLFVAVRTSRGDGHDYLRQAAERGAGAFLVRHAGVLAGTELPLIVVDDPVSAVERYAQYVIAKWKPRVVAVTGTVGKTSAKEMIAHVLADKFSVFKTPGNFGGRYGLSIAIGELQPSHEVAVLEMSTGHFGEMAAMCEIATPEVSVVTAVDAAHLLALEDIEGVAREKSVLVRSLPQTGLAVLNADDARVLAMAELSAAPVVTFGTAEPVGTAEQVGTSEPVGAAEPAGSARLPRFKPDVRMSALQVGIDGTSFDAETATWSGHVEIPWLGIHSAGSVLSAIAVAAHFGIEPDLVISRVRAISQLSGRLHLIEGVGGSRLIDDTYNAAPLSMTSALRTLGALAASKRIAVLGDMAELGRSSEEYHRQIGRVAAENVDLLVTVGNKAAWIADEALRNGLDGDQVVITFASEDASRQVLERIEPGALILVKASAPSRAENVVKNLMKVPGSADRLLVRQGPGWASAKAGNPDRPTWLEVDLGAIAHNVANLYEKARGSKLMAVLKADAYGHGAVQVAHTALLHGASLCGVACLPEARILREARVDAEILVLGYTPGWQAREAVSLGLTLSVFEMETALEYSKAAQALDRQVKIHVKVDTGMHRLGVDHEEAADFTRSVARLPGIEISGIFTHFAMADDLSADGRKATDSQKKKFEAVLGELASTGDRPPVAHAANSAALLERDDVNYDLVRPGIAIYGLPPDPSIDVSILRPALSWKSQIAQIHQLPAGEAVGYGHIWSAQRDSVVGVVPAGYADGFRRGPNTWEYVLVRGERAPVIGRVSMDQMSIDLTDIPQVRGGDEVVLIGRQNDEVLPATTVAGWLGTSCYEVVSEILARVPRVN